MGVPQMIEAAIGILISALVTMATKGRHYPR